MAVEEELLDFDECAALDACIAAAAKEAQLNTDDAVQLTDEELRAIEAAEQSESNKAHAEAITGEEDAVMMSEEELATIEAMEAAARESLMQEQAEVGSLAAQVAEEATESGVVGVAAAETDESPQVEMDSPQAEVDNDALGTATDSVATSDSGSGCGVDCSQAEPTPMSWREMMARAAAEDSSDNESEEVAPARAEVGDQSHDDPNSLSEGSGAESVSPPKALVDDVPEDEEDAQAEQAMQMDEETVVRPVVADAESHMAVPVDKEDEALPADTAHGEVKEAVRVDENVEANAAKSPLEEERTTTDGDKTWDSMGNGAATQAATEPQADIAEAGAEVSFEMPAEAHEEATEQITKDQSALGEEDAASSLLGRSDDSDEEVEDALDEFDTQKSEGAVPIGGDDESDSQVDLKGVEPAEALGREITVYYMEGTSKTPSVGRVMGVATDALQACVISHETSLHVRPPNLRTIFSEAPRSSIDMDSLPRSAFVLTLTVGEQLTPVWLPIRDKEGRVNEGLLKDAAFAVYHEIFDDKPVQVPVHTRSIVGDLCAQLKTHKMAEYSAKSKSNKDDMTPCTNAEAPVSVSSGKFKGWTRKQSKTSGNYYLVSPDGKTKLWEAQARKQLDGDDLTVAREYPAPRALDYGSERKEPKPHNKRVREESAAPSKRELKQAISSLLKEAAGSKPIGEVLDELSATLGCDVRPQKPLVKELILSTLRKRAIAT
ncbi:hypothetical protein AB1Y20_011748 [Prymnesium parvum]|uniref:Transcription initiation factor IIF subunit alpha n=1 Tax=Prymnesium parvum TaxID=97485 RepID=A0AB34IJZ2_PRYPA